GRRILLLQRRARAARESALEDQRFEVDPRIGKKRRQREVERAARSGAALQLEPVDRGEQVLLVLGGRLNQRGGGAEGDDRNSRIGRVLLDEALRRDLRGREPI